MKVAIISSLYKPTQINAQGGQETWTALFTQELAKRNYQIDLYALANSIKATNIKLIEIFNDSLEAIEKLDHNLALHIDRIRIAEYGKVLPLVLSNSYDVIIDSTGEINLGLQAGIIKIPIVVIGHFPVEKLYTYIFKYLRQPKNVHYIFPSDFQLQQARWLKNTSIIIHGIDIKNYLYREKPSKNSFFWVGRVNKDDQKGLLVSIKLFAQLSFNIEAYANFTNKQDFMSHIIDQINSNIIIIDTLEQNKFDKYKTPGIYKALIYPLQWDEPFGLVMIESMACGTPVIAFARGSVPEIIKDGQTGFIVNYSDKDIRGDWIIKKTGLEGLREAVEKIYTMSENDYNKMRANCRKHAEINFNVEKMINKYERAFEEILKKDL